MWSLNKDGIFSALSFRNCLEDLVAEASPNHSFIWQGVCPPKVETFVWQLLKERVMVRQVLKKFGIGNGVDMECPFCNSVEKSINHLFLHCSWTKEVWLRCMKGWDVNFCANSSLIDWARGWPGLCPRFESSKAWNTLFFAIVWTVWELRNQLIFRGKAASVPLAVDMVGFRIVWWFKYLGNKNCSDPITLMMLNIQSSCVSFNKSHVKTFSQFWQPSSPFALRFNVDGSSHGNPGDAGIGGVLRECNGKILGLFSTHISVAETINAEIHAIFKACEMCVMTAELRRKPIFIVSDSKIVVSWVVGCGSIKAGCV